MKIIGCKISPYPRKFGDPLPIVRVTFEDGSEKDLFRLCYDEIGFTPADFIGLTEAEARKLRHDRDVAYVQA